MITATTLCVGEEESFSSEEESFSSEKSLISKDGDVEDEPSDGGATALTCVNKQTGIAGGYRSTQQQGGATCEANKWCMKIRSDSGEGEDSKFLDYFRH